MQPVIAGALAPWTCEDDGKRRDGFPSRRPRRNPRAKCRLHFGSLPPSLRLRHSTLVKSGVATPSGKEGDFLLRRKLCWPRREEVLRMVAARLRFSRSRYRERRDLSILPRLLHPRYHGNSDRGSSVEEAACECAATGFGRGNGRLGTGWFFSSLDRRPALRVWRKTGGRRRK